MKKKLSLHFPTHLAQYANGILPHSLVLRMRFRECRESSQQDATILQLTFSYARAAQRIGREITKGEERDATRSDRLIEQCARSERFHATALLQGRAERRRVSDEISQRTRCVRTRLLVAAVTESFDKRGNGRPQIVVELVAVIRGVS